MSRKPSNAVRLSMAVVVCTACGPVVDAGSEAAQTDTSGSTVADGPSTSTTTRTTTSTSGPGTFTTTGTSTSDTTSTDTGRDFIMVSDGGSCVTAPGYGWSCIGCDLWEQDCPRGQKCSPWANDGGEVWNAVKCSPVDPNPAAVGESCLVEGNGVSGVDDCEHGAFCFDVDPDTQQGTCVAQCKGSEANPQCPDGTTCAIANQGSVTFCLPTCDPLATDCEPDEACRPTAYGEDTFFCLPVGSDGLIDDGCAHLGGCGLGELCIPAELHPDCPPNESCCTSWCDLTDQVEADATCEMLLPGSTCIPYLVDDAPLPGFETLGHCGA